MTALTASPAQWLAPRLPMLPRDVMTEAQQAAADRLIAGPRKAVKGPFIALLRRPELVDPVGRLGAVLRFESTLPRRVNEFATLVVSRHLTQQFEWATHVPLALAAGTLPATIEALAEGRRPEAMHEDEALAYDLTIELLARHGLCDASWAGGCARLGETAMVELVTLVGYFAMVSLVLNVARTPPEPASDPSGAVAPLRSLPAFA